MLYYILLAVVAEQADAYVWGAYGRPYGFKSHRPHQKNDLYIHCASLFFCKGVRDLNGTLRKQHSALFLVPGVSTALAEQKKAYETPAPVGLRSKSHRPHQQKRRYCYRLFFIFCQKWCGVAAYFKKLISNPLNRYNSFLILLTLFQ